jgi:uncharacterized membrane protein YhiD involved in acid resistance
MTMSDSAIRVVFCVYGQGTEPGVDGNMAGYVFAICLVAALLLGALVGAQRQWRQRTAGLRTNCLVAAGSAMFVMTGSLVGGEGSQGRVAAYDVCGVGFPGGGVKDGFSIRGRNTAAMLWCSAAVRTLARVAYARGGSELTEFCCAARIYFWLRKYRSCWPPGRA